MKKLILSSIVSVALLLSASAQDKVIKEKLQHFFFDLSFNVDLEVIRTELGSNPNFKFYHDSNRDAKKTILGTVTKAESLNPAAASNLIIVQYSSSQAKKKKKVSLKCSINYKVEDLAIALLDFEKLKSEFKPLFTDFTERLKAGQQGEEVNTLTLKTNSIIVTITLIKYNNFIHTISLEYLDVWKIEPIDILNIKY